jgi:perosamine synthetase
MAVNDVSIEQPAFTFGTSASKVLPLVEPDITQKELQYVSDAVSSGWVSSLGPYVGKFEHAFAAYCATRYAVSTCNGTAALHLALAALKIKPGDEVIIPSLTFMATASAVAHMGAIPVFADSDPQTWCMDPESIRGLVSSRTRAIIAVHLYGHPAEMGSILALANDCNIPVIEDAAEAHGALYRSRPVGGLGSIGIFSFFGNKLITTGEGGMLVTGDHRLAKRARFLASYAMHPRRRYWHPVIGFNYRLSNIQAALGLAQLERIGQLLSKKLQIFRWYQEFLAESELELNPSTPETSNSYWLVCALLPNKVSRDAVMRELQEYRIETRPFFYPMHTLPPFRKYAQSHPTPVVAADIANRGINLPSGVNLSEEDVYHVAHALTRAVH